MNIHIVYCHPSENSLTAEVRDAFIQGLKDSGKPYTLSDLYKTGFMTDMTEAEYLRDAFYDRELPLAADVLAEQELINAAEALVFIYPVFWTEAPAKLVGWFDRVWRYGFAYGAEECDKGDPAKALSATPLVAPITAAATAPVAAQDAAAATAPPSQDALAAAQGIPSPAAVKPMKTLDKALFIAIAGNTEETLREQGRLQSMENVMLGDRIHDRAKHKEFILCGGTERNNAALRAEMREVHLKTAYTLACEL